MKLKSLLRCRSRRAGGQRSRAAAVVEFAVVLPLLLTILFGIIEYGWIFMVRQTLQTAAREGCRVAILQSSTTPYTEVTDRVQQVMSPTGLAFSVTMTHSGVGNPVETVEVAVPFANISLMGNFFGPRTGNIAGTCSMRKEAFPG